MLSCPCLRGSAELAEVRDNLRFRGGDVIPAKAGIVPIEAGSKNGSTKALAPEFV